MTDSWEVVKWFSNPVPGGTLGFLKLVGRHFKAKKNQIKSKWSRIQRAKIFSVSEFYPTNEPSILSICNHLSANDNLQLIKQMTQQKKTSMGKSLESFFK